MTNGDLFTTLEQLRKTGVSSTTIDAIQTHIAELTALTVLSHTTTQLALDGKDREIAVYNSELVARRLTAVQDQDYEFDGD